MAIYLDDRAHEELKVLLELVNPDLEENCIYDLVDPDFTEEEAAEFDNRWDGWSTAYLRSVVRNAPVQLPIILTGAPGVGKSEIIGGDE